MTASQKKIRRKPKASASWQNPPTAQARLRAVDARRAAGGGARTLASKSVNAMEKGMEKTQKKKKTVLFYTVNFFHDVWMYFNTTKYQKWWNLHHWCTWTTKKRWKCFHNLLVSFRNFKDPWLMKTFSKESSDWPAVFSRCAKRFSSICTCRW